MTRADAAARLPFVGRWRITEMELWTAEDLDPERVLTLAIFFGAIVAWVTDHLPDGDEYTDVPCRRSPGHRRCRGEIIAVLDGTSGYVEWHCPLCGDNGLIHGWEDTPWDRQHYTRAVPTIPTPTTAH